MGIKRKCSGLALMPWMTQKLNKKIELKHSASTCACTDPLSGSSEESASSGQLQSPTMDIGHTQFSAFEVQSFNTVVPSKSNDRFDQVGIGVSEGLYEVHTMNLCHQ